MLSCLDDSSMLPTVTPMAKNALRQTEMRRPPGTIKGGRVMGRFCSVLARSCCRCLGVWLAVYAFALQMLLSPLVALQAQAAIAGDITSIICSQVSSDTSLDPSNTSGHLPAKHSSFCPVCTFSHNAKVFAPAAAATIEAPVGRSQPLVIVHALDVARHFSTINYASRAPPIEG
jgi:Protein of unknown function (DUF2946)